MAFTYNPLLSEINGLSDAAKGALGMAGHTLPSADPGTAPQLPPGMLLPHPDAGPPAGNISMPDSPSLIGMPKPAPQLVMGPKSGQEMLSNGQQLHPGTLLGDKAELERQAGKKPALESVYSGITGSKFGEAHPFLGKLLGGLAQIPATALDVAASLPYGGSIARLTPGTTLNNRLQTSTLENRIAGEENNAGKEAATAATEAEVPLRQAEATKAGAEAEIAPQEGAARIAHENAATSALENPKADWKELTGFTGPNGEPLEINAVTGETRPVGSQGAKPKTPTKEQTPQQQTYDSLIKQGMTPVQAYEKIREKPASTTIQTGTWALDEDEKGNPVLFNSKTGETKAAPAGIQKAGTHAKAEAAQKPVEQALNYAADYGSRSVHTGPGDEALMEKFFELAKPSSGFRMSQPQIDMLKNAQSWMSGLEAHLRHATTGTWFSDEQRKQIVDTMGDLGKAKGIGAAEQPQSGKQNDPLGIR